MNTFKIIKEMGGFSSDVYLVELDNKKYVLKRSSPDEIISEKIFNQELCELGLPVLNIIEDQSLKNNEILIEYIENSPTLSSNLTMTNCKKRGELVSAIHHKVFPTCFKYNEYGEYVDLMWTDYIKQKIQKAFLKADQNKYYDFSQDDIEQIRLYLDPLLDIEIKDFSLIHGDFHAANILIKDQLLIPFDKNPLIFSGDPLLDLAIIAIEMPYGTLCDNHIQGENDVLFLNAFVEGYGENFLLNPLFKRYVMLIAFGRMYTPFSSSYKSIIYALLHK